MCRAPWVMVSPTMRHLVVLVSCLFVARGACGQLPPFMLAQPSSSWSRALAGNVGAICSRHDETDSSTEQCQEWCRYPEHCDHCKCRACSLCKPCSSSVAGDIGYEACEAWCAVPEHCSSCKCRACPVCKACTPHDTSDTAFEDAQPWCTTETHCKYCKCKQAPKCKGQCTPFNRDDDDYNSCQKWCQTESYHCPYCKWCVDEGLTITPHELRVSTNQTNC